MAKKKNGNGKGFVVSEDNSELEAELDNYKKSKGSTSTYIR